MGVPISVAVGNSALAPSLHGGYNATCMTSLFYDHGEIHGLFAATCWTNAGDIDTYHRTTIDLNHCLVNRHGLLEWGANGGAMKSCNCNSRRNKTGILNCACKTGSGEETLMSSVNLDEGIYATADGLLACFNIVGDQSST